MNKRFLINIVIGSVVLVLSMPNVNSGEMLGDINGDGKVGLEEAIFALQVVAGIKPPVVMTGTGTLSGVESSQSPGKQAVTAGGKQYVVQSNQWGGGGTQQVTYNGTHFSLTMQTGDNSGVGQPVSFPSAFIGNNNNRVTTDSSLPKQVSSIASVNTTASWATGCANGIFNATYEVWFTNSAVGNITAPNKSLMVWLYKPAQKQPFGSVIAIGVTFSGIPGTWTVWSDGTCISYVANQSLWSVSFDLNRFIQDSVSRGVLSNNMYLHDVFAGFQVWSGGVGLTLDYLTVLVN